MHAPIAPQSLEPRLPFSPSSLPSLSHPFLQPDAPRVTSRSLPAKRISALAASHQDEHGTADRRKGRQAIAMCTEKHVYIADPETWLNASAASPFMDPSIALDGSNTKWIQIGDLPLSSSPDSAPISAAASPDLIAADLACGPCINMIRLSPTGLCMAAVPVPFTNPQPHDSTASHPQIQFQVQLRDVRLNCAAAIVTTRGGCQIYTQNEKEEWKLNVG